MKDIIIIGSGVAGMTAAIYGVRNGFSVSIFESKAVGGQIVLTQEVENYPGFKNISGFELAMNIQSQAESLGVQFIYEEVSKVDLAAKCVNDKYYAKNIVLAMGQSPKQLGLSGESQFVGRGVSYCAVCDAMFYRNKKVAVIGGGNTAISDSLHLSKFCEKVYLIHRRDKFRASAAEVAKINSIANIEKIMPDTPTELIYDDKISGLKLESGRQIDIHGMFLAIGYTPNTQIVSGQIRLSESGYIIVDNHMQTNISGVYACGDIIEKPLRQLVTACSDGAIAAESIKEKG